MSDSPLPIRILLSCTAPMTKQRRMISEQPWLPLVYPICRSPWSCIAPQTLLATPSGALSPCSEIRRPPLAPEHLSPCQSSTALVCSESCRALAALLQKAVTCDRAAAKRAASRGTLFPLHYTHQPHHADSTSCNHLERCNDRRAGPTA
jgi:hypothetical protein